MQIYATAMEATANSTMESGYASQHHHRMSDLPVGLSVLVVEDSDAVRGIMLEHLSQIPNVTCSGQADNQASAIEALRSGSYDAVILDIKLKSGTGLGVLRALLAPDWQNPPTTRIMFTNYADSEFRTLARKIGATHFFDKTLDFPELLSLIAVLASPPAH